MEQNRELKSINDELDRLQADLKKAEEHLAELQRLKATGDAAGPSRDADKPPTPEALQPPTDKGYSPGQESPGSPGGKPDRMPDDLTKDQAIKDEQERQRLAAEAEKARQDQAAKDEAETASRKLPTTKRRARKTSPKPRPTGNKSLPTITSASNSSPGTTLSAMPLRPRRCGANMPANKS